MFRKDTPDSAMLKLVIAILTGIVISVAMALVVIYLLIDNLF